jgi:hypothetical protein
MLRPPAIPFHAPRSAPDTRAGILSCSCHTDRQGDVLKCERVAQREKRMTLSCSRCTSGLSPTAHLRTRPTWEHGVRQKTSSFETCKVMACRPEDDDHLTACNLKASSNRLTRGPSVSPRPMKSLCPRRALELGPLSIQSAPHDLAHCADPFPVRSPKKKPGSSESSLATTQRIRACKGAMRRQALRTVLTKAREHTSQSRTRGTSRTPTKTTKAAITAKNE